MRNLSDRCPKAVDVAVVGAGPQALTLVTHLLQKKKSLRDRLAIFDPAGTWMQHWKEQFAALDIPHLRSPAVHHPDPDPYALRRFATSRSTELFPPYDLPGTRLFEEFCEDVVRRWELSDRVIPTRITHIEPTKYRGTRRFRLESAEGSTCLARRVVLATGEGLPNFPDWVKSLPPLHPPDALQHSNHIDLRRSHLQQRRVLIVGSGLTSGHLAIGAVKRGATVTMVARREFYGKLFDADPGWLGPKYLKGFHAERDWDKRAAMVRSARNGGSLTPAILLKLRQLARQGKVEFVENCQIATAAWTNSGWRVEAALGESGKTLSSQRFDRLWLATGTHFDIRQNPLLAAMWETHPVPVVGGLPVLSDRLRWGNCELFLMGAWTALQVGPVARNLYGGKLASECIVPALTKASLALPVSV
nr:FAD/NAD(P)-binding protein [Baaleninema simplex]